MKTRKSILWVGSAVLAAAVFATTLWTSRSEDATPAPAVEPDLFAFVKPQDSLTRIETITQAPAPLSQDEPPKQAPAEKTRITPAQLVATELAVREMRAQGASEDAIYRLRATALTAEVATQLAGMESEEATWRERVDAYLVERGKLTAEGVSPDMDVALALQQLRDAHFTAEEQQRLNAYEPPVTPRPTLQ